MPGNWVADLVSDLPVDVGGTTDPIIGATTLKVLNLQKLSCEVPEDWKGDGDETRLEVFLEESLLSQGTLVGDLLSQAKNLLYDYIPNLDELISKGEFGRAPVVVFDQDMKRGDVEPLDIKIPFISRCKLRLWDDDKGNWIDEHDHLGDQVVASGNGGTLRFTDDEACYLLDYAVTTISSSVSLPDPDLPVGGGLVDEVVDTAGEMVGKVTGTLTSTGSTITIPSVRRITAGDSKATR